MSGLRIKSVHDLNQMRENKMPGDRAASRIEREMEATKQHAKRRGLERRPAQAKPETLQDQLFCSLPPLQPADRLYQALVSRWGRFYSGGEVVWELQPFSDSGYRLDAALVNFRIALEWMASSITVKRYRASRKTGKSSCDFADAGGYSLGSPMTRFGKVLMTWSRL